MTKMFSYAYAKLEATLCGLHFSPCGRYLVKTELATEHGEGRVTMLEVPSLHCSWTRKSSRWQIIDYYSDENVGFEEPVSHTFSPSGSHLVIVTRPTRPTRGGLPYNETFTALDSQSGNILWTVSLDVKSPTSVAFNAEGSQIAILKKMYHRSGSTMTTFVRYILDASTGDVRKDSKEPSPLLQLSNFYLEHLFGSEYLLSLPHSPGHVVRAAKQGFPSTCQAIKSTYRGTTWIWKDGRRMLYLPVGRQETLMSKYWASHPHCYIGFDSHAQQPFIIDFPCSNCSMKPPSGV
ncbi:hypothetical protein LZ32DRAFT_370982 [Colletotrichum eremochloae]|nr:hypothetical protein LZ32DRAFT_370982 [Colletotrichum eremochloae]